MRRVIYFCLFLFVLSACASPSNEKPTSAGQSLTQPNEGEQPQADQPYSTLKPIATRADFTKVVGWFDHKTVLFYENEEDHSIVYRYNLISGEKKVLFATDQMIIDINGNDDYSLFTIQTITKDEDANLYVIDHEGSIKMYLNDLGESFTIYWSEEETKEFVLIAYLQDWAFDIFHVNVANEEMRQIDLEQTSIQSVTSGMITYLNQEEKSENGTFSLYEYDLIGEESSKRLENIIAYHRLSQAYSFQVTIDSIYDLTSTYTFYNKDAYMRQLYMPILNTYSDEWWLPFHAFSEQDQTFYYLRPKYSSDYISYTDGFELVSFHLQTGEEEVLTVLDQEQPFALSPDYRYVLVGYSYEYIFDLENKQMKPLLLYPE